ncbi:DUF6058 family natural product biosynthesis protein [Undibacterium sp. YM2]|uniref:DUF6058 family natural product biosynthesis protein n=1 Tax=Undibacterium sp. YM2 TaxID=2058625 RepID=UPI00138975B0|nr:DUF6058 family natural product biosynthesis protein [Undibacterium sp. YM2]
MANQTHQELTMSALDLYLKKHYLNKAQFAVACLCKETDIEALIQAQLLAAPSYVVTDNAKILSAVFGEMDAVNTSAGAYFHPANVIWHTQVLQLIDQHGRDAAPAILKENFIRDFIAALTEMHHTTWRLEDCFTADDQPIVSGLMQRAEFSWQHFLLGTFGLCVTHPVSVSAIVRKEILQEKLAHLSDNGNKENFTSAEAKALLPVVDAFAEAAMWFSPAEYPRCSRKRLVDDLRPRLLAAMAA